MFEIGRADSFGPCENCRVPSACMDCSCPVKSEDMPDPLPREEAEYSHTVYVSEASRDEGDDEPGCNECDGFVWVGHSCPSCGLKGTQQHKTLACCMSQHETCNGQCEPGLDCSCPCHSIVRQAKWQRCAACGKTGDHTHSTRPTRVATDDPLPLAPDPGTLDQYTMPPGESHVRLLPP